MNQETYGIVAGTCVNRLTWRGVGKPGLMLTLITLLSVGCGQKAPEDDADDPAAPGTAAPGGGGGGGTGGPVGVDDSAMVNYMPMVDGSNFTYSHSAGWAESVTVTATGTPGEFLVADSPDPDNERTESTFVVSGTRVLRTRKLVYDTSAGDALLTTVEYDPGFVRVDSSWGPEDLMVEQTLTYVRTETLAGQAAGAPEDRQHIWTVEGVGETVMTAAGSFRDCLRVRRKRDWMTDIPDSEAQEKIFWFAPGIGKVREENTSNGNVELLIDYDIPGG